MANDHPGVRRALCEDGLALERRRVTAVTEDIRETVGARLACGRKALHMRSQEPSTHRPNCTRHKKCLDAQAASAKQGLAEFGETKAAAEGDMAVTTKAFNADVSDLAGLHQDCMTKDEDDENVSESESDSESLGNDNPLVKPESGWHSLNVEQLKTLIHRMGFSLPAKCNKTTMATKLDQILTIQEAHNKAAREAGWEAPTPGSEAANKKRRISKLCNPENPEGIIGSEKFPLAD